MSTLYHHSTNHQWPAWYWHLCWLTWEQVNLKPAIRGVQKIWWAHLRAAAELEGFCLCNRCVHGAHEAGLKGLGWSSPCRPYGALWTPRRIHQDSLSGPEPHWGETARSRIKTEQVIDKREEGKRRSRSKQGKKTQKTSESSCQSFEHYQKQQRSCSSVKLENLSWIPTHPKVRKPNFI